MLIATLPTAVSDESFRIAESIIKHRDIQAVRYNTGGDSPYAAKEILGKLKVIADHHRKILYVDLEGRQTRVAVWTPQSRGSVILNRQFEIQLPGMIYFRKAGWCEIVNADIKNSKLYFRSKQMPDEYFLGEGQSVHVVANKFIIKGCLGGRDHEFVKAAAELGIDQFMLSFVESFDDCLEVEELFATFTEPKTNPDSCSKSNHSKEWNCCESTAH